MSGKISSLAEGNINEEYFIKEIDTKKDEEMRAFLLSLGCYSGEKITIISKLHKNFIVSINGARYSIDEELATAIKL